MTKKVCSDQSACRNPEPQSILRFYRSRLAHDGHTWACRKCVRLSLKNRIERNGGLRGVARL